MKCNEAREQQGAKHENNKVQGVKATRCKA
jgi:hypothetical protein